MNSLNIGSGDIVSVLNVTVRRTWRLWCKVEDVLKFFSGTTESNYLYRKHWRKAEIVFGPSSNVQSKQVKYVYVNSGFRESIQEINN